MKSHMNAYVNRYKLSPIQYQMPEMQIVLDNCNINSKLILNYLREEAYINL